MTLNIIFSVDELKAYGKIKIDLGGLSSLLRCACYIISNIKQKNANSQSLEIIPNKYLGLGSSDGN